MSLPDHLKTGKHILLVGAPWCQPCKTLKPHAEQIAATRGVGFAYLDGDADMDTANALNIRAVPTVICFNDGEEVMRQNGNVAPRQLDELVKNSLGL